MRRWLSVLLLVMLSLGIATQQSAMSASASMPGHDMAMSATSTDHPAAHAGDDGLMPENGVMAESCAILCIGAPAIWPDAALLSPDMTGQPQKRHFTVITPAGRPVAPDDRPPRSI